MSERSEFSVGMMAKFAGSWCESLGTTEELNSFAENSALVKNVLEVIRGRSEIKLIERSIDLGAKPFVPEGWTVEEHKGSGQWKWNAEEIELHLAEGQKNGKCMKGHDLKKELANQPVLNANVLDFLLKHPELIPEEWKGKVVFFWGTIYRDSDGSPYVRYLYWDGARWSWDADWLDDEWHDRDPAAVRAI